MDCVNDRQFDFTPDKIIGNPINVSFTLSDEVVDEIVHQFGIERNAEYEYTIVTRNGHEWLCAVSDELRVVTKDDGVVVHETLTNVLREAYCLTDIKDKQELDSYREVITFEDTIKKYRKSRIKSNIIMGIISFIVLLASVACVAYVLMLIGVVKI